MHPPNLTGNLTAARQGKDSIANTERVASQDEHHPSYKSRVTELSKTLTFSEDVVSSRSPHCISYAAARRGIGGIFRTVKLEQEPKRKTTTESFGRYNYRGEPKKHTCNFYGSVDEPPTYQHVRKPLRRVKSVPSEIPESVSGISSSEFDSGSAVVHHRAREVPASVSVRWEEETLHRLSSATARRLVSVCPRTRDRERMDALLEKKHGEVRSTERKPFLQASKQGPDADSSSALILPPAGDEDKNSSDDSPPRRDFLAQLQGGARPVRQKKPDSRTIVLDNDAHFVKTLQRVYPQEPRDWCESEAVPGSGRRYVRGQLRWTDMPQPVKVRRGMFLD